MVKITVDLIEQCAQYTNAVKEREIDLRGYKISVIENMGATLVSCIGARGVPTTPRKEQFWSTFRAVLINVHTRYGRTTHQIEARGFFMT